MPLTRQSPKSDGGRRARTGSLLLLQRQVEDVNFTKPLDVKHVSSGDSGGKLFSGMLTGSHGSSGDLKNPPLSRSTTRQPSFTLTVIDPEQTTSTTSFGKRGRAVSEPHLPNLDDNTLAFHTRRVTGGTGGSPNGRQQNGSLKKSGSLVVVPSVHKMVEQKHPAQVHELRTAPPSSVPTSQGGLPAWQLRKLERVKVSTSPQDFIKIMEVKDVSHVLGGGSMRVVVLGPPGVGKTALTQRFATGAFVDGHVPTTEDRVTKTIQAEGVDCTLEIVDTGGGSRGLSQESRYFETGHSFILVHDLTDPATFEKCREIRNRILVARGADSGVPILFVGTKADLVDKSSACRIHVSSLRKKLRDIKTPHIEISVVNPRCTSLFYALARWMRRYYQEQIVRAQGAYNPTFLGHRGGPNSAPASAQSMPRTSGVRSHQPSLLRTQSQLLISSVRRANSVDNVPNLGGSAMFSDSASRECSREPSIDDEGGYSSGGSYMSTLSQSGGSQIKELPLFEEDSDMGGFELTTTSAPPSPLMVGGRLSGSPGGGRSRKGSMDSSGSGSGLVMVTDRRQTSGVRPTAPAAEAPQISVISTLSPPVFQAGEDGVTIDFPGDVGLPMSGDLGGKPGPSICGTLNSASTHEHTYVACSVKGKKCVNCGKGIGNAFLSGLAIKCERDSCVFIVHKKCAPE